MKPSWCSLCTMSPDGAMNRGHTQADLIIMDFAKAFDKVPHRRLLHKLEYYGIRGSTHMDQFLALCAQSTSSPRWSSLRSSPCFIRCTPGVGLRTDSLFNLSKCLPDNIKSLVRLFADDCVLYRNIHSLQDCLILKEDLGSLALWEADWQIKLNVAKCHSIRLTIRHYSHKHIIHDYTLHQQTLTSPCPPL